MSTRRVVGSVRRWTTWTCSSCHHKVDLGALFTQKERGQLTESAFELARTQCPSCGSPKSKKGEGEIYRSAGSNAVVITDSSILARTGKGANRECEFCGSENVVLDSSGERIVGCRNCGAGLEGQTGHPDEDHPPTSVRRVHPPAPRERREEPVDVQWPPRSQVDGLATFLKVLGGIAGLFLLIWFLVFFFGKHDGEGRVSQTSWQVTHIVYQRQVHTGSGWKSGVPASAYSESCTNKFKEMESCSHITCNPHEVKYNPHPCNCHTEVDQSSCRGNEDGTEDCDTVQVCVDTCYDTKTEYDACHSAGDEVYEDWCDYKYDTWPEHDRATTSGHDKNPRSPSLEAFGGDQKIDKIIVLTVKVDDVRGEHGTWVTNPSTLHEYQKYEVGQVWRVEYNRAGQVWPLELLP